MPTSTNVTNLKINELTEAQYDAAVQGGVIGANELSVITDMDDAIQVTTMPTAGVDYLGRIVEFTGTTDANYTNGYFYKCVSDGQNPATYSWSQVNVQPGSSLPSQTGNAGKFLTTDGTDASWGNAVQNVSTGSGSIQILPAGSASNKTRAVSILGLYANDDGIAIGYRSYAYRSYSIGIGYEAYCYGSYSVAIGQGSGTGSGVFDTNGCTAIGAGSSAQAENTTAVGYNAKVTAGLQQKGSTAIGAYAQTNNSIGSIQLGRGTTSNTNGVFNVGLSVDNTTWNNYRLLDSDGTIPTDRFTTTPPADGTYTPTVTIASGVATRSWAPAASAPVVPSTMPTLAVADWSSNTQTVNVTSVTASNIVFVSPAPASAADYAAAGIVCTAQGAGTLTFSCQTVPSNAITVNVVILG